MDVAQKHWCLGTDVCGCCLCPQGGMSEETRSMLALPELTEPPMKPYLNPFPPKGRVYDYKFVKEVGPSCFFPSRIGPSVFFSVCLSVSPSVLYLSGSCCLSLSSLSLSPSSLYSVCVCMGVCLKTDVLWLASSWQYLACGWPWPCPMPPHTMWNMDFAWYVFTLLSPGFR